MSWSVAGSSTLATWRRRFPPLTPPRSTWHRARGSCLSTTCRRPRNRPSSMSCSDRVRQQRMRAFGFWLTASTQATFAGSDPATRGFMIAPAFSGLEQVGAIVEGNSLDAEAGAEAANLDDLFERLEAAGRLMRIEPVVARNDVSRNDAQRFPNSRRCGRSQMSSGSAGFATSNPAGLCSSAGSPTPVARSCMWTALRLA